MTFPQKIYRLNIEIIRGDITSQKVDAIVNAANSRLQHGAGVAGAILKNGGDAIRKESEEWINLHGPVSHDRPAITSGGKLPCKYIIHAVGPIWGEGEEHSKLEIAISSSLRTADELKCKSIAFPAISTGIFGFPEKLAANTFKSTIDSFSQSINRKFLQEVFIVLFNNSTYRLFLDAFTENNSKGII